MPNPTGISTHVLDTRTGRPAAGVSVELFRIDGEKAILESSGETNADGRIADLTSGPLRQGTYRIVFHVAGYARKQGLDADFFAVFSTEFLVGDTERRYHVPLILAPYSCMTYLGS